MTKKIKFKEPSHIDYLIAFYRDKHGTPSMTTFSHGGDLIYHASMIIFGEALAKDSLLEEKDHEHLEYFCKRYLEAREKYK